MKKVSLLVMISMLTFSVAFSQKATDKKPNAFLDYMQGRSVVGFNFMPSLNALGINIALDSLLTPMIEDIIQEQFNDVGSGLTGYKSPTLDSKKSGFGMIFSYELTVLPYLVVAVDAGFVNSSLEMTADNGGANFSLKYGIVPYSFGVKFFTGRNAPWGFYLYPKIGGTVFNSTINSYVDAEKLTGQTAGSGETEQSLTQSFSQHGMYASLEIGWRIQLFPKMGKDWPVQVGIDIALFDLGYYFLPWIPMGDLNSLGTPIPDEFSALANIRFLPIPKIGFSIRF